ncbi:L-rhamnose mutarotase [Micromonospora sp. DT201]|uniref:L-rhamnose mutarotase n=1 Tax=Micromonospora sp. DT201 TaxID=3393442 RepID=UPI003CEB3DA1
MIRLRPEQRETYLRLHAEVWPSVEKTLREANFRNYTIFLHDDLLFGYYEYVGEDYDADLRLIAADPQTQEWWKLTDPCQESVAEPGSGDWWAPMREVWHLTDETVQEAPDQAQQSADS